MANKAYLKYREQELKQLFKAINKKGITSVEITELIRETKKRLEAARKELA